MDNDTIEYIRCNLRYDAELGMFWWLKRGPGRRFESPVGCVKKDGYVSIGVGGKVYKAHRLAFLLMGEPLPTYVDHINGSKTDNRWSNLRAVTKSQNCWNSKSRVGRYGGPKGAHKHRNGWCSEITHNGNRIYLGFFDCPKKAHEAYKKAAEKYFGEFARYE